MKYIPKRHELVILGLEINDLLMFSVSQSLYLVIIVQSIHHPQQKEIIFAKLPLQLHRVVQFWQCQVQSQEDQYSSNIKWHCGIMGTVIGTKIEE